MQKYKSRNDVPNEYKWDLTDIYKDLNAFNESFDKIKSMIPDLTTFKGCLKDSDKLFELLELDQKIMPELYRLQIYAYIINDQELGISENMDRLAKVEDLFNEYSIAVSYFAPELLSLSNDEYNSLFANDKLKDYKKMLNDIYRMKEHILPEEQEVIISKLGNASMDYENISSTMLNSLHDYGTITIDGEEEKITQTNMRRLLKNKDKGIRKEIRKKYNDVINQYSVISSSLLNSYVKTNITNAKIHNYKDAWDAKLFTSKMPNEAYEALRETVENNVDKYQRYYKLFKEALKLDVLEQCDLKLNIVDNNKEYSIEEAQEICLESIKPLGDDYYNHFKKVFDNHYIDYACYPGKCSGGYSISGLDFDSRILMSYNYDLDSISTIIHEGGHNVHQQYINGNNLMQYRDVSPIISEVASLTNECLLSSYLAEHGKTKEERIAGIDNILSVINSNLYGAVREGKMEQDFYNYVNEGNTITKDYMNELCSNSISYYYGDILSKDEYSGLSWVSRSHYYMNFYLYAYSICVSIASYVASEILNGNKEMLDNYIKFLSTGTDKDNVDIFKVLGVDITDKNVYTKAINYYDSMLDKLEELLKEGE